MKLKILGTAAAEGIPGLFCTCDSCKKARVLGGKNLRTRSQSIINDKYLIDYPPDTYQHMLAYNLNLAEISHLIVTHAHDDHFYPVDFQYRRPPFGYNSGCPPLNIYGNDAVMHKYMELRNKVAGAMMDDYIRMCEIKAFKTYQIGELTVTPLPALHARDMECFIYIFESEGKRLLYGHDSGFFPDSSMEQIKSLYFDCVILDCTTGSVRDGKNHMGVEDNFQMRDELLKSRSADKNTVFIMSHFSHNGRLTHGELEEIAGKNGFIAAFDGFEIIF